ncbi:MAG: hypothetical protein ACRDD4_03225 [Culicoidibacterales bacterium]
MTTTKIMEIAEQFETSFYLCQANIMIDGTIQLQIDVRGEMVEVHNVFGRISASAMNGSMSEENIQEAKEFGEMILKIVSSPAIKDVKNFDDTISFLIELDGEEIVVEWDGEELTSKTQDFERSFEAEKIVSEVLGNVE